MLESPPRDTTSPPRARRAARVRETARSVAGGARRVLRWMRRPAGWVGRELAGLAREARSWPTLLLVVVTAVVAIPVAVLLTPGQEVVTLGQHVTVKARPPSLTASGPAQIVQIGNTSLDIPKLNVYGPVRPRLEMGPAVRSEEAAQSLNPSTGGSAQASAAKTIAGGWLRWCAWGYLVLLGGMAGLAAAAACLRLVRHQDRRRIVRMVVVSFVTTSLLWVVSCAATAVGAPALGQVKSFADLVGQYHLSPTPVGPKLFGYEGVVIGDSRAARVGGPPVAEPTQDDVDCNRSTDSLSAELGLAMGTPGRVLNLACPSASIREGLMGSQPRSGRQLPPQVAIVKQILALKYVVVMVGPNDLFWSDFIRYCYGAAVCNDKFIKANFEYRLTQFDRDYGDLLQELNDLASKPQVIVVGSYDAFDPEHLDPACPDAKGPAGVAGLTVEKVRFLASLNAELNEVLTTGAGKYRFDVAQPVLAKLCQPSPDGLGPDLQGIGDPNPFHPTATGMVRLGTAVTRLIRPAGRRDEGDEGD